MTNRRNFFIDARFIISSVSRKTRTLRWLPQVVVSGAMSPNDLPLPNAVLNFLSAVFLALAFRAIRRGDEARHRKMIFAALTSSSVFLVGYLVFHYLGHVPPFGGGPVMKAVFFSVLASHTVLAAFVPPMVGVTLWFALRNQRDRHKKIAPWTMGVWFYVSVTGVLIYVLKFPYY